MSLGLSLLPWSELTSRLKERFGAPVRSKLFCFLHLLKKGNPVPMTITSTANAIQSQRVQSREVAAGLGAAASGVLAGSEDGLEVVAAEGGVPADFEDELSVTAGVVAAAAGVADRFRGRATGVAVVSAGVLTAAAGAAAATTG